MPSMVEKIKMVSKKIKSAPHSILLEVDGGITPEIMPQLHSLDIDILVAGSSIFGEKQNSYKQTIDRLRGNK